MSDEQKEKLQQEVVRRYENLSDELKRAMMSVSSAEIIYEVGRKHNLNVEKIGILAEEIGYIMLGMVPASGFISDLKDLLEVEEPKAREVAQEINHKIFLPIREEMKRAYGTGFSEDIASPNPQPTTYNLQPTATRPIPPPLLRPTGFAGQAPLQPTGFAGQAIPPRPTTESGLGQRPVPPPIPQRPAPEFGSGPRIAMPPTTYHTPPTTRPVPPPIFSQPKEITKTGEVAEYPLSPKDTPVLRSSSATENGESKQPTPRQGSGQATPTPPEKLPTEEPARPLPEVEEELKPKKLLESLPKEKPMEARIAEKNPPKYHTDPYKEPIE